jgi:DNA polymerase
MNALSIDIETYSSNDLVKGGVYKYVEAEDFEILLFAYAYDKSAIEVIDLTHGQVLPDGVLRDLSNADVLKTAYNAAFERTCIAKHFGLALEPNQWECTMVKAGMLGLPMSLDAASKALKLDTKKDAVGKTLIRFFCLPCKPTLKDPSTRKKPALYADKWQAFKDYCVQDVAVERAIREKISFFEIPESEKQLWQLDQRINDRGVLADRPFITNAISLDAENRISQISEAVELTGLDNPNSASQLKVWLSAELDQEVDSLKKADIPVLLEASSSKDVSRVLSLRQELSKTSVKKYEAMRQAICKDDRIRGLLQFYGANRTGRWAGRLVQVQNLPQNHLPDLDLARNTVSGGDLETLELLYGNVPDTLSQLIRTAFIAPKAHRFIIADFSAIEARVIAWLAGERWRMQVFASHGKIYEASAAQMFNVPLESVTKGSPLRQKGKIAELALGYQGGAGALITMGALSMGLDESELAGLVRMWRNANRAIVKLWSDVENAAIEAADGAPARLQYGLRFYTKKGILVVQLPSGRCLHYQNPKLSTGKFGNYSLSYEGINQTTRQWCRQDTYGGKLVENIVQAIARDCLAVAMLRLDEAGYRIAIHVHDEVVLEVPDGFGSLEQVNAIMSEAIPWANGLDLKAESYQTLYYKKD